MERYKIDIAALQETRFLDQGQLKENSHTFYWSGKPSGERRETGVAFAISNQLVRELESLPTRKNDRLISLRIHIGRRRYLTLISAYAPTMTNENETKELFYRSLDSLLSEIPAADKLILLGDFNARVGKDHEAWPQVLGKFGRGKMNSNGEMLLTKCSEHELAITNTFFNFPDKWYHSWKHPRSKHPTLLDYIITRRCDLRDFRSTRAMRGAECSTDHFMIRSKCNIKLKPHPMRKKGSKPSKKLNVEKLRNQNEKDRLATAMNEALPTLPTGTSEEQWKALKSAVYTTASEILGKPTRKHADWFDESNEEIMALVNEKNLLFHRTLADRCTRATKHKYKEVKAELQKKLRQMKNDWWTKKAAEVQSLADRNDSKAFFASLKEVYGPRDACLNW